MVSDQPNSPSHDVKDILGDAQLTLTTARSTTNLEYVDNVENIFNDRKFKMDWLEVPKAEGINDTTSSRGMDPIIHLRYNNMYQILAKCRAFLSNSRFI